MEYGYIYKLSLNKDLEGFKKGEIYIGKHDGKKSEYFASGKIIKRIKAKYGKEVFDREIIVSYLQSEELLCFLEMYYIDLFKSNRSRYNTGLNLTDGGEGISGYKMTDTHKENMIAAIKKSYELGKRRPFKSKQVHKYNLLSGDYIESFDTCYDAMQSCGLKSPSSIAYCARRQCNSTGGFIWSYEKKNNINQK